MKNNDFNKFANSFQAVARLQLEGTTCLMKHLGNPQNSLKFIHVAGTNGKGSVCSFLQSIFTEAGFVTGKYTSPNLISVCERISIDGKLISENDINRILKNVEIAANKVQSELGDFPTQFEIWTAAAFYYFKEQNCDLVILETGLGGTRDATNVISPPLASVITQIDIDHTEYLGNTLKEIADAKAGIIKNGSRFTFSQKQLPDAESVLKATCKEKNVPLFFSNPPTPKHFENFHEIFDYTTEDGTVFTNIECGITGFYQPENACLAIEVAHKLGINRKCIENGIRKATNPGRFEVISTTPTVIYDGAHNKNGMMALAKCLTRYFPEWNGATFIMAFMGDKDIRGEFEVLKNFGLLENSEIFVVKVKDNPRAENPETVCQIASKCGVLAIPFSDLKDAYLSAISKNRPTILCGSLYLYKDFSEISKN